MTDFPDVKLKALVNFPAAVYGRTGITVDKEAGGYFFDLDYADFQITPTIPLPDVPNSYNLIWDEAKHTFAKVPFALQMVSPLATGDTQFFDNRASAAATQIAAPVISLIVRRYAAGDVISDATFKRGTGLMSFVDALGATWSLDLSDGIASPHWFGAKGDGTTNDRAAFQAAIDAMSPLHGIVSCFARTYRIIIDGSATDIGLVIKANVTVLWNQAIINLECSGNVYGVRLQSNANAIGPGTLAVLVSAGLGGSQDTYHSPFVIGASYGEVMDVNNLGPYINASHWSIRNLTIIAGRTDGFHIAMIGGINNGVIEDIVFPDSAIAVGCINMDWGTVGNISSADVPGSRVRFDAGTAYTVHPNNIDVRRIKIGLMTNANSAPLRLSACHAIRFDGFDIGQCNSAAISHYGGDVGYEFADPKTKLVAMLGNVFRNGVVHFCGNSGYGMIVDSWGDNLAAAIAGGYVPYLPAVYPTDLLLENIVMVSKGTTPNVGIYTRFIEGGTFRNCTMNGFLNGFNPGVGSKRVRFEGGQIIGSQQSGIEIYSGLTPYPEEITIDGARVWGNATAMAGSGIDVEVGKRHTITRCRLGNTGDTTQDYGIQVTSGAVDVEVTNNHVVAAVGDAYVIGVTYGCLRLFAGNTVDPSVGTAFTGAAIVPIGYNISTVSTVVPICEAQRAALTGGITPPSGTWAAGSEIRFVDPVAGGKRGSVCIAGGTPGTWKLFGAIDP